MELMEPTECAYLEVLAGSQRVLFSVEIIESVILITALQSVPNTHASFRGMLNYHGLSVPIYCMAVLLDDVIPDHYDLDTQIILVHVDQALVGLIVHRAMEVVNVRSNSVQQPNMTQTYSYVKGIVKIKNQSYWILDIKKLLDHQKISESKGKCL